MSGKQEPRLDHLPHRCGLAQTFTEEVAKALARERASDVQTGPAILQVGPEPKDWLNRT